MQGANAAELRVGVTQPGSLDMDSYQDSADSIFCLSRGQTPHGELDGCGLERWLRFPVDADPSRMIAPEGSQQANDKQRPPHIFVCMNTTILA
jgi:hypothetical protein